MVSWIVYLARVGAAFVVAAIGVILLVASLTSGKPTLWSIGVSSVITLAGVLSWPRRPNSWRVDPPTDRQIDYASDLGIAIPRGISKGQLSDLISQAAGK